MKLYTTVKTLKEKNACYDEKQWQDFMIKMNLTSEDQSFNIASGLEVVGIKDCVWALCTQKSKDIAGFTASIANLVLPIYQKKYPSDRRVQRYVSLAYKYAVNLCNEKDLREAAADVYNATYAAATDVATYATYSDAAAYAIYADAYAVYSAAYAATYAAATDAIAYATYSADAAAYAAYSAAFAATNAIDYAATYSTDVRTKSWGKIEELFIQYFSE